MRLRIGEGLLHETFAVLAACGGGENECVVWWLSSIDTDRLEAVVHPQHSSGPGHYSIDGHWLHRFWIELAADERTVRAQVHTHPGSAYHSHTDDRFPLVHSPGFLSLVIPNFAQGEPSLEGAHLAEFDVDGGWRSLEPAERLLLCP